MTRAQYCRHPWRSPARRLESMTLAELAVVAGLWSCLTALLGSVTLLATRGLAEGQRAAALCLAASAIEQELSAATSIVGPGENWTTEHTVLRLRDGRLLQIGIEEGQLCAGPPSQPRARVLARRMNVALFHGKARRDRTMRYALILDGRCLITASRIGRSP